MKTKKQKVKVNVDKEKKLKKDKLRKIIGGNIPPIEPPPIETAARSDNAG